MKKSNPTELSRRHLLQTGLYSSFGLAMKSLITGLPATFLATGSVHAADVARKHVILSVSTNGEAINASGPQSFENAGTYNHALIDDASNVSVDIGGTNYSTEALAYTTDFQFGDQTAQIASCFDLLPNNIKEHLVWFQYKTGASIHSQTSTVLKAFGSLKNSTGNGTENLPSVIAQENATELGSVLTKPFVLQGEIDYEGSPLTTFSPVDIKSMLQDTSLATNLVNESGGNFSLDRSRDFLIDRVYQNVRSNGTSIQRRFFDEYALSRTQAKQMTESLLVALSDIDDNAEDEVDLLRNQMKAAVALIKLNIAPVIVVKHSFTGDNHVDPALVDETTRTLNMINVYRALDDAAVANEVQDSYLYATCDVFGRDLNFGSRYGRNHNGDLVSGLIFGGHTNSALVGGLDLTSQLGASLPINSTTGLTTNPDVMQDDLLACYYKTIMRAAGIPDDRLDFRIPSTPAFNVC